MAEVSGHTGAVAFAGNTINFIRNWSMDYSVNMLDSTSFADTFKEYKPGIKEWAGSFEALVDGATAPVDIGTLASATFTLASGKSYSGSAYITNHHPAVAVDDIVTITYDYLGTGTCTPPA